MILFSINLQQTFFVSSPYTAKSIAIHERFKQGPAHEATIMVKAPLWFNSVYLSKVNQDEWHIMKERENRFIWITNKNKRKQWNVKVVFHAKNKN